MAADLAPGPRRLRLLAASLMLSLVALVLSCGAAELGVRLAGYSPIYDVYSKPSLLWIYDAELGWRHQPGATATYVGPRPFPIEYETPIHINAQGLRGPDVGPKKAGEFRVLVLGDSLVAGFEVSYDETFTALLQERLKRRLGVPVRVINAGVRGYGTDQELLYYRRSGRALEPDLVLLAYSLNDLNDNVTLHRMRRPFGKGAFALREDGSLSTVAIPVRRYPLCSAWMLDANYAAVRVDGTFNRLMCFVQTRGADRSALLTFVSQALGRMPSFVSFLKDMSYPTPQQVRGPGSAPVRMAGIGGVSEDVGAARISPVLSEALLAELGAAVQADGSEFFVLIRPATLLRMAHPEQLAEHLDLRTVRAPRHLDPKSLRFRNDAHYNARGHALIARGLAPIVAAYARKTRPDLPPGKLPAQVPGRITPQTLERERAERRLADPFAE